MHALNLAHEAARGDIIFIFDDDSLPRRDWLTLVLEQYKDPAVAAVGARDVIHENGVVQHGKPTKKATKQNFWGIVLGNHHTVVGEPRDVDVLKGCN